MDRPFYATIQERGEPSKGPLWLDFEEIIVLAMDAATGRLITLNSAGEIDRYTLGEIDGERIIVKERTIKRLTET